MGRKKSSNKARKGKQVASKGAAAPADVGGASTSRARAPPPLHGRPSLSVSAPPAAILTAVPSSVRDVQSLGAPFLSSSSSRSAAESLAASLFTPETYRAAVDGGSFTSVGNYILDLRDHDRRGHALAKLTNVAAIILQGVLQHREGLQYLCHFPNQLAVMLQSLENVVAFLSDQPSARLLKAIVKCYLHLQNDSRTLKALRNSFPERFSDGTFDHCVREDQTLRVWLQQLLNA